MFTIQPRDYQIECLNSLWNYFLQHSGNPVCALPTGTGKSVCIAMFNMKAVVLYPQTRILNLVHVKELIEQNFDKFMAMWNDAPAGIYSASLKRRDTKQSILFAGVASVVRALDKFGVIDLIVVDECHLVSDNEKTMYYKIYNHFIKLNPNLKVVGFTATPWRLGAGHIVDSSDKAIFTDICFDVTTMEAFNRFISEGYLIPLIPKTTHTTFNLDNINTVAGDFDKVQLATAMDVDKLTLAALHECFEYAEYRKHWLFFTTSIQHAINVANYCTQIGRQCKALHSKMSIDERNHIIEGFKAGEWEVANMGILTTGFDFPALDFIGMLAATQSPVKWVQTLGRGTRPDYAKGVDVSTTAGRLNAIEMSDKQNCLVLDFGKNAKRLGPINDPVMPRKKGKRKGTAPIKECPVCGGLNHASARYCVGVLKNGKPCTHEFTFEVKFKAKAGEDEIMKVTLPKIVSFKVDTVVYARHKKVGKPDAVKVQYYCGIKRFVEYVCIEHGGFPTVKARQWWTERTLNPMPATTNELLNVIDKLVVPTHIKVWVNKPQFPEVQQKCYDGSNFNTETPTFKQTATIEKEADEEFNTDWQTAGDEPTNWQGEDPSAPNFINDDDIPF